MRIDVIFNAARNNWPAIRDGALQAEASGFGCVWVYDHLSGSVLGGDRMLECFSLAGALCAVTTTIDVGTLVVNAANRPAPITVVGAASLQEISGGRFRLGLGAGASPGTRWSAEHTVAGIRLGATMAERHARLVEVLDLCLELWKPAPDPKWAGFPRPTPPPPVLLGVNSVALSELAARRCNGLNVRITHPRAAEFLAAARRVRDTGAGPEPFELTLGAAWCDEALDPDGPTQTLARSLGADRLMLER